MIEEFIINIFRLGPQWYKEAPDGVFDFHYLDCHIQQQAAEDGKIPACLERELPAFTGTMLMDMHGRVYPDPKSVTTIDSNNNDNKPNIGPKTTEKAKPQPPTWDMKKILDEVRLARSPVNTQSSVRMGHHRLDYEEKVEM